MIEMRIIGPNMDMLARSGKSSGHKPLSATPASHARQAVMRGRLDGITALCGKYRCLAARGLSDALSRCVDNRRQVSHSA